MTQIVLVVLTTAVASISATASNFLFIQAGACEQDIGRKDVDQRVRDFFTPAEKSDLHSGQEMRPRW